MRCAAEDLDIAIAIDRLGKATTLEVNRIVSRWAGLRSFVSDHSLVIGPDADLEDFYWVAGQGGYDIQTSPAVARTISALANGGDVPDDLRVLGLKRSEIDPARPAGSSLRRFQTRHVRPTAARASCRCIISMPAMTIVPPSR